MGGQSLLNKRYKMLSKRTVIRIGRQKLVGYFFKYEELKERVPQERDDIDQNELATDTVDEIGLLVNWSRLMVSVTIMTCKKEAAVNKKEYEQNNAHSQSVSYMTVWRLLSSELTVVVIASS